MAKPQPSHGRPCHGSGLPFFRRKDTLPFFRWKDTLPFFRRKLHSSMARPDPVPAPLVWIAANIWTRTFTLLSNDAIGSDAGKFSTAQKCILETLEFYPFDTP